MKYFRTIGAEIYNYFRGNKDPLIKRLFLYTLKYFGKIGFEQRWNLVIDRFCYGETFTPLDYEEFCEVSSNWHFGFHGPLDNGAQKFFLETLKLYKRYFPNSTFSYSSVKTSNLEEVEAYCRKLNLKLILIEDPGEVQDFGARNILRQVNSTFANIEYCQEIGKKYFIKNIRSCKITLYRLIS